MKRFFTKLFSHLLEWLGFEPARYKIARVTESPNELSAYVLYAIGEDKPWLVTLLCPCGCGDALQLSLIEQDSPHWSLTLMRRKYPTLTPSVWRTKGCRAHFVLKAGRVYWCGGERS